MGTQNEVCNMSGYAAVTEAFRLADKQNGLLREAIRIRAEKAKKSVETDTKTSQAKSKKKK